jgi:small-conductance mechanosensitive channel
MRAMGNQLIAYRPSFYLIDIWLICGLPFSMSKNLATLFIPALTIAISAIIFFVVRSVTFKFLHRWAEKSESKAGDVVIAMIQTPSIYWCIAIALYLGLELSELPRKYVLYLDRAIYVILILSITLAAANLSVKIFENYARKFTIPLPTTGIVYGVLKGSILTVGFLIILNILGISITPLLTALGVGGLAVALALKDTLSNLFAGLHIIASRQINPGNYIKMSTGEEGYVADITWRSTTIKAPANNMVIIPNATLASANVTNYDLPDKQVALIVKVTASYSGDLEKVEKIAIAVGKKVLESVPGGVPDFEPSVRYNTFGDFGIDLSVILRVKELADQYLVKHEFIKTLHRRFREEGIEFPVSTPQTRQKEEDQKTISRVVE